jgi:hypothetical protein
MPPAEIAKRLLPGDLLDESRRVAKSLDLLAQGVLTAVIDPDDLGAFDQDVLPLVLEEFRESITVSDQLLHEPGGAVADMNRGIELAPVKEPWPGHARGFLRGNARSLAAFFRLVLAHDARLLPSAHRSFRL